MTIVILMTIIVCTSEVSTRLQLTVPLNGDVEVTGGGTRHHYVADLYSHRARVHRTCRSNTLHQHHWLEFYALNKATGRLQI